MTGPASAVVRRVPCPPRTRLGGSSPPQRRLADHVAHEPPGAAWRTMWPTNLRVTLRFSFWTITGPRGKREKKA